MIIKLSGLIINNARLRDAYKKHDSGLRSDCKAALIKPLLLLYPNILKIIQVDLEFNYHGEDQMIDPLRGNCLGVLIIVFQDWLEGKIITFRWLKKKMAVGVEPTAIFFASISFSPIPILKIFALKGLING